MQELALVQKKKKCRTEDSWKVKDSVCVRVEEKKEEKKRAELMGEDGGYK